MSDRSSDGHSNDRSIDGKFKNSKRSNTNKLILIFNKIIPQNGVIRIWTEQAPSNAVNRSYQWIFDPTTIASGTYLWGVSLIFRETVLWIEFDHNNSEQTKYVKICSNKRFRGKFINIYLFLVSFFVNVFSKCFSFLKLLTRWIKRLVEYVFFTDIHIRDGLSQRIPYLHLVRVCCETMSSNCGGVLV